MTAPVSAPDDVWAWRVADYDRPLWVSPNRNAGRWNQAGSPPTQYWSTHPAAAWAEALRNSQVDSLQDLHQQRRRLWVARLQTMGLVRVPFDAALQLGLRAEDLVDDDWTACQAAATRLRTSGTTGIVVPSAALPGGSNVVLFGPRVAIILDLTPLDDADLPIAAAAADAHAPEAVLAVLRRHGEAHNGLLAHQHGQPQPLIDVV